VLVTVTTTTNQLALEQSLEADRELQKLRPPATGAALIRSTSPATATTGEDPGDAPATAVMRMLNYTLSLPGVTGGTSVTGDSSDSSATLLMAGNGTNSTNSSSGVGPGSGVSSRAVLGMLLGIPYGMKDVFVVPRYPTTWGLLQFRDRVINEVSYTLVTHHVCSL
jgi:hypothetical protein